MRYYYYYIVIYILISHLAFSQTINLDQTGDGHTVTIHQKGDNLINIEQIYGSNTVDITQVGSGNQIDMFQGYDADIVSQNYSEVLQHGERNYGNIEQKGGYINSAYIEQNGNNNKAEILQPFMDENITGYNYASIYQYGSNNQFKAVQLFHGNKIEALQIGDYNSIEAGQSTLGIFEIGIPGAENYASYSYIWQEGKYNISKLTQSEFNNKSFLTQVGNNNHAEQSQHTSIRGGGLNTARITQEQNNAYAYQYQNGVEGGEPNYAEIYQRALESGEENYTRQLQEGGGNKALAHTYHGNNHIIQEQRSGSSDGNWSYIQQGGHFNNTQIYQYGMTNAAYVQTYSYWSDYNNASVIQGEDEESFLRENYASIYIYGSHNTAGVEQYGSNNQIGTGQHNGEYGIEILGNNNIAEIYQRGDNNSADLHLLGDGLEMKIKQVGDDIYTSITQEN